MKLIMNEATIKEISDVFNQHSDRERSLRIFMSGMQCSGPSFGLAIDPAGDGDSVETVGDFQVVIENALLEQYDEWSVESVEGGYIVRPTGLQPGGCGPESGGGCSSCGCGGGCH